MNYLDKQAKDSKQKEESDKGNGCISVFFVIAIILVIVGLIAVNYQQCSHESYHYQHDINTEAPIHRD